jgi:hypothetical protein
MTLNDLILRVRSYTRDTSGSIFAKIDVVGFINEGIDRIKVIPQLTTLTYLNALTDTTTILPEQYHYLLAVYSASRCMFQDEQDGRAGTLMNEFETKMEELRSKIDNGEIIIKDIDGNAIVITTEMDYIMNEYFDVDVSDEEYIVE